MYVLLTLRRYTAPMFLALLCSVGCGPSTANVAQREWNSVVRPIEPPVLSELEIGETAALTVELANHSDQEITIVRTIGDCGCGQAEVHPPKLRPWGRARLDVTIETKGKSPGRKNLSYVMIDHDGETYELEDVIALDLRRTVVLDRTSVRLEVSPTGVASATESIDVFVDSTQLPDSQDVTVKVASVEGPINAQLLEATHPVYRRAYKVDFTCDVSKMGRLKDPVDAQVVLQVEGLRGRDREIPVFVNIVPLTPIQWDEAVLFLGGVTRREKVDFMLHGSFPRESELELTATQTPDWAVVQLADVDSRTATGKLRVRLRATLDPPSNLSSFSLGIRGVADSVPFETEVPVMFAVLERHASRDSENGKGRKK